MQTACCVWKLIERKLSNNYTIKCKKLKTPIHFNEVFALSSYRLRPWTQ